MYICGIHYEAEFDIYLLKLALLTFRYIGKIIIGLRP